MRAIALQQPLRFLRLRLLFPQIFCFAKSLREPQKIPYFKLLLGGAVTTSEVPFGVVTEGVNSIYTPYEAFAGNNKKQPLRNFRSAEETV